MITFREATDADTFAIVSNWTQSFRASNTAGMIQDEDWYPVMDAQVAKALRRPDVRTVLACHPEADDRIAGFITADIVESPPLVYYVYVREPFRRGGHGHLWRGPGLARQLFAAIGVDPSKRFHYVCSTPYVRKLERKIPLAKWRPLYGRFPKAERRETR